MNKLKKRIYEYMQSKYSYSYYDCDFDRLNTQTICF